LPLPEDWVTLIDGILATAVLLDLALNRRPGVVEGSKLHDSDGADL
jgi:hypothetical protein